MSYQPIQKRRRRVRLFTKDIESLLYSLGDGPVSLDSTINTLDDVLTEYLVDACQKAQTVAKAHGRTRIKTDDIPMVFKDDPLKLARMQYIKDQSTSIEMAKKMFDQDAGMDPEQMAEYKEQQRQLKRQMKEKEREEKKRKKKEAREAKAGGQEVSAV